MARIAEEFDKIAARFFPVGGYADHDTERRAQIFVADTWTASERAGRTRSRD